MRGESLNMYKFLTIDCDLFLPAYTFCTMLWFREIMCERKKAMKCSEMSVVRKSKNINGLRIPDLVAFFKKHGLEDYLPNDT